MKNILKYLKRTRDAFLIYGRSDLKLDGFTDFNFQSDLDDNKSISGYVFILYDGIVSQKNFKQQTVADSITETEYIAASEAAKKIIWMKKFISELDVVSEIK